MSPLAATHSAAMSTTSMRSRSSSQATAAVRDDLVVDARLAQLPAGQAGAVHEGPRLGHEDAQLAALRRAAARSAVRPLPTRPPARAPGSPCTSTPSGRPARSVARSSSQRRSAATMAAWAELHARRRWRPPRRAARRRGRPRRPVASSREPGAALHALHRPGQQARATAGPRPGPARSVAAPRRGPRRAAWRARRPSGPARRPPAGPSAAPPRQAPRRR